MTMTFSQSAIEAAAEAMKQRRRDELERGRERATYEQMAELALSAALAVDGVALVPVEPTEAMIEAGESSFVCSLKGTPISTPEAVWEAMLSAASEGEERSTPPAGTEG